MCLEDFRTTATDLRNRLMMNYHDVARLAGNAFHMPSVGAFAASALLLDRSKGVGTKAA
jgi:hypothetical protein